MCIYLCNINKKQFPLHNQFYCPSVQSKYCQSYVKVQLTLLFLTVDSLHSQYCSLERPLSSFLIHRHFPLYFILRLLTIIIRSCFQIIFLRLMVILAEILIFFGQKYLRKIELRPLRLHYSQMSNLLH